MRAPGASQASLGVAVPPNSPELDRSAYCAISRRGSSGSLRRSRNAGGEGRSGGRGQVQGTQCLVFNGVVALVF